MALEGSIKEFGLADILQLIYFQKKTGVLRIEGPFDVVSIYFKDGNIVGTKSSKRPEELRVGRILVKKGYITEEVLAEALKEQKQRGIKLGDVLLEKNLVDREILKETLIKQITDQIVNLFSWKEGTYIFRPTEIKTESAIELSIDTQHLLMEGLRIIDEWSVVEGEITIDTIFRKTHKASLEEYTKGLDDKEMYLLTFIDGETDVGTITEMAALDDLEVSRALIRLKDRGLIEEVKEAEILEPPAAISKPKPVSQRVFVPVLLLIIMLIVIWPAKNLIKEIKEIKNTVQTEKRIEDLRLNIEWYRIKNGHFPDTFSPGKDPWQEDIIYRKTKENGYILYSKGPDRKANTPDDIY